MKTLKLTGNMVTIPIDRTTGDAVVDSKQRTKNEAKAALDTVRAVADAIRELGSVPSGTLYAVVMSYMDLATYERIISILKNCGLVAEEGRLLTWTGPKPETETLEPNQP
jgi:hypothetical protein